MSTRDELGSPEPTAYEIQRDLGTRIARVEAAGEHYATREDLANLKVWILLTAAGAVVSLASVGLIAWRVFAPGG